MTLITDMVADLYDKYDDVWDIPDNDPIVIKLRYWFDPNNVVKKPNKQPYDKKVVELYNQGLSDAQIAKKIGKSPTIVLRTRRRLNLGIANIKKPKYKFTDLLGNVTEHVSLGTVSVAAGLSSKACSFNYLKKRVEKKGYKLERITK